MTHAVFDAPPTLRYWQAKLHQQLAQKLLLHHPQQLTTFEFKKCSALKTANTLHHDLDFLIFTPSASPRMEPEKNDTE